MTAGRTGVPAVVMVSTATHQTYQLLAIQTWSTNSLGKYFNLESVLTVSNAILSEQVVKVKTKQKNNQHEK